MKILIVFTLLLAQYCSTAQQFTVTNDRMNIVYLGVDNPISVSVENLKNNDLRVEASNGTLTGRKGKYLFRPLKVGEARIAVYNSKKILGYSPFLVRAIPVPVFSIGSGGDTASKAEIVSQQYVRAELRDFQFDIKFRIDSFIVSIFSPDSGKIYSNKNIGNKIADATRNMFQKLKINDILFFDEIYATGPDTISRPLAPGFVRIKNPGMP